MCVKVRPPRPVSPLSLRQSSIYPRLSSPGPEVAAAGGSAAAGPITARQPSSRPIGGLLAAAGRVIVSCERLSCRWQDFISKINTRTGGTTTQHRAQLSDARPQKPQLNLDLKTKNNPCLHLGSLLTVQMIHWTWHRECQIYLDAWFVLMLYSDSQTMAVGTHSEQWSRYSELNKSRYVAVNLWWGSLYLSEGRLIGMNVVLTFSWWQPAPLCAIIYEQQFMRPPNLGYTLHQHFFLVLFQIVIIMHCHSSPHVSNDIVNTENISPTLQLNENFLCNLNTFKNVIA